MAYTVIRLRGKLNVNPKIRDTLQYMHLTRVNHAVVLPENETTQGMLKVAKDYVTWGETDAKALAELIRTRGRLSGNKPVTDEHIKENTDFDSINAMAEAIVKGDYTYKALPGVKPIFRLAPARKGLEGIKRSVQNGGALGYRADRINELVGRMS